MSRRNHIIYAHPASTDGYAFFYLYYVPGDPHLALRYRRGEDEVREITLLPVPMLDLIESQATLPHTDPGAQRAWDRAAKALRTRLKAWLANGEGD